MGDSGRDLEVRSDQMAEVSDEELEAAASTTNPRCHDVPLSSSGQCRGFVLWQ
jgi:hypothetical protein